MALYPLVPLAAGAVILGWLFVASWRSAVLAGRGARTNAEVVGYHESAGSSRIMVRFHTDEGNEVLAAHVSTGWAAARHGDTVTVAYDPDRPDRARIVTAPWLSRGVPVLWGALGACCTLVGALLGVLAWS
ncbi:DUF3592 domain-containing protein [Marinactinospora rubrisoli]|uniref:DUF3592 domain-containing protein n=1 Tax=Marinactinospora rubrisoli TaxID=2715399 RepID=A0ABW2KC28_9ACTN